MDYDKNYHGQTPASVDFRSNRVKRRRFNSFQLRELEDFFETDIYPNTALREEMAKRLELPPRNVQVWFQNHRSRVRKRAWESIMEQKGAAPSRLVSLDEGREERVLEAGWGDDIEGRQASDQPESSRDGDASQSPTRSWSPPNLTPDGTEFPGKTIHAEHIPDSERVDLEAKHMESPARLGHESHSAAGMFTNAQVKILGGTFQNVVHIHESNSPAQGGGPAFPIAMLSLQAMSFVTRSHYPHCNHLPDPFPLSMPKPTSTASVALHFPSLYRQTEIMGSLTLWYFLIKLLVQRRTVQYH